MPINVILFYLSMYVYASASPNATVFSCLYILKRTLITVNLTNKTNGKNKTLFGIYSYDLYFYVFKDVFLKNYFNYNIALTIL